MTRQKQKQMQAELVRLRRALEAITHVVGNNSCSDGQTPNGFVVALDGARNALKVTPIANAASLLDQVTWTGSASDVRGAMKTFNASFKTGEAA